MRFVLPPFQIPLPLSAISPRQYCLFMLLLLTAAAVYVYVYVYVYV